MDPLVAIAVGVWLFLPAYVANPSAVLTGFGTPVDLGWSWRGRRILGDGKTWNGLIGGTLAGGFIGLLQMLLAVTAGLPGFGEGRGALIVPFILAFGALVGDMLGSLIKRRFGIERGASTPILDQYDFVIGTFLMGMILAPDFIIRTYLAGEGVLSLVAIIVLTPPLHRAVNILGYRMGQKDVPW